MFRDAPIDIWGGGGGAWKKIKINSLSPQKSEKEVCWKCEQKKQFVVEIDEKYVDQKNHQMLTYIIGKAYDKKKDISFLRRQIVRRWLPKKKDCFLVEAKKSLQATKTLAPPPPRYLMVRPLCQT